MRSSDLAGFFPVINLSVASKNVKSFSPFLASCPCLKNEILHTLFSYLPSLIGCRPTIISGHSLSQPIVQPRFWKRFRLGLKKSPKIKSSRVNWNYKKMELLQTGKNYLPESCRGTSYGGTGDTTPKYPIPPGNWLMFVKFRVTCGVCIESFGITTLNVCDGYQ